MEKNKIGKFLVQLRKEQNLTQYDIADQIPISREAVSKWERGITKPNKSSLERLSEIFDISVEEILIGKRLSKNKKEEIKKLTLELYGSKLFLKKVVIALFLFLVLIIILFLLYYFLSNYNSIKVYTINNSSNNTVINDGILVLTKDNIYFSISNVQAKKTIRMIALYYIDDKNKELIYSTEDCYINLYDFYGYNSYFDYNKMDYIIDNLYLDISYDDNEIETIKLNFIEDFANNKIYNDKEKNIVDNKLSDSNFSAEKIKSVFKLIDNVYIYEDKKNNLFFSYIEDANLLNLISSEKDKSFEWYYYFDSNTLEYNEYQDQNLVNSFNYSNNNIICNINNCQKDIKKVSYFYDNINNILE